MSSDLKQIAVGISAEKDGEDVRDELRSLFAWTGEPIAPEIIGSAMDKLADKNGVAFEDAVFSLTLSAKTEKGVARVSEKITGLKLQEAGRPGSIDRFTEHVRQKFQNYLAENSTS